MPDLSELSLRTSYHKGRDDIARDFYLPCMSRSTRFDRAVGYFRSTAFIIAWPALKGFVQRGGKIQVLCSQVLADADVDALEAGYAARVDANLAERFKEEVSSLLKDETVRSPARILAGLVAQNVLDLQIAVLRQRDLKSANGRIFHDKLGIFRDNRKNRVVFKGSMNETWTGLAADGNLESVDVAATWLGARDLQRCQAEEAYFDELWGRNYPGLLVRPFPQVAREELTRAAPADLEAAIDEALETEGVKTPRLDPRGRVLKSHQAQGLAAWAANGRRGVLALATGAGKTFTALSAMREGLTRFQETVVVIVPDRTLFSQWDTEIREALGDLDLRVLRAGAGHSDWSSMLKQWTAPSDQPRLVLSTIRTAASEVFRQQLSGGRHLTLVADEVHNLGARKNQGILVDEMFGARLGLSATPERYGDADGTAAILNFFGGVLLPRYELADAIRDGVLTPYFYRPHPLLLEQDEAEEWNRLTREVRRLHARFKQNDSTAGLGEKMQNLLIARARVVKQARAKINLAVSVLKQYYRPGERWLIYCDDGRQLTAVTAALHATGVDAMAYHSAMEGDRGLTLKWLARRGGVVVAIKCLDEGVDIPSVTHALILASSRNPREFVQRRGRVLRKSPGKALAYIHDAIVLSPRTDPEEGQEEDKPDALTAGELVRAIEFAEHASNPASATDLQLIAIRARLNWNALIDLGVEDAED